MNFLGFISVNIFMTVNSPTLPMLLPLFTNNKPLIIHKYFNGQRGRQIVQYCRTMLIEFSKILSLFSKHSELTLCGILALN